MNSYSHCSRMRRLAALALVLALASGLAASPSRAELARESRSVAGIDRVLLGTVGELEIPQAADEALVVEAEPRVLRQITTAVSQGTLTIDTTGGGFSTREPVRFLLRVKRLAAIASTASGSVHTAALAADHLRLELAGSGDMRVDALTARTLAVEMPGAGSMEIGSGHVDP